MADGRGRPSKYTEQLVNIICFRLAEGESLRQICSSDGIPDKATILRWLFEDDKKYFHDQYARAREIQAENWADEILEIADDGTNDWVTRESQSGNAYKAVDQEVIGRSRLRVDSRKWLMSKLLPKKYGDRIEHRIGETDDKPLRFGMTDDQLIQIAAAANPEGSGDGAIETPKGKRTIN